MVLAWRIMTHCFQCLAVGTYKSLPPHCPLSEHCAAWTRSGIGNITHWRWKCQTCWSCSERIHRKWCHTFLFYPPFPTCVDPSLHQPLLCTTITSTCQFQWLRLEEMRKPSMHHWGAAAGCLDTCQSGRAFLIIAHTHYAQIPIHPNACPHTPLIHIRAHIHTHLATCLKGSQWVPGGLSVYPFYAGPWEDSVTAGFRIHTMHCQASQQQQQCNNTAANKISTY